MKICEAIAEADRLKPNAVKAIDKIRWLYRLDEKIKRDIIDTHEGAIDTVLEPYTEADTDRELLVLEPYADIYVHYLEAQIDYANLEYDGYGSTSAMFEASFEDFRNDYNRHHMHKGVKKNVL